MFRIVALVIILHHGQPVPGTFIRPDVYDNAAECELARTTEEAANASRNLAHGLMIQGLRLLPVVRTQCEPVEWVA